MAGGRWSPFYQKEPVILNLSPNMKQKRTIFAGFAERGLDGLPVFQLLLPVADQKQRRRHDLVDGRRRVLISSYLSNRRLLQVQNVLRTT